MLSANTCPPCDIMTSFGEYGVNVIMQDVIMDITWFVESPIIFCFVQHHRRGSHTVPADSNDMKHMIDIFCYIKHHLEIGHHSVRNLWWSVKCQFITHILPCAKNSTQWLIDKKNWDWDNLLRVTFVTSTKVYIPVSNLSCDLYNCCEIKRNNNNQNRYIDNFSAPMQYTQYSIVFPIRSILNKGQIICTFSHT